MGAPKQKWTSEEEAALKAGMAKHGSGKWRAIIKDPQFSSILSLRSNVDLKDKWRNMSLLTTGERPAKGTNKRRRLHTTTTDDDDEDPFAAQLQELLADEEAKSEDLHDDDDDNDDEDGDDDDDDDDDDKSLDLIDAKPLNIIEPGCLHITVLPPKKPITRLENLILEAITTLKEPKGSNHTNISKYIEGQYDLPPNFRMIFSEALKGLIASGKLIKVNRKYRIPPSAALSEITRNSEVPQVERQKDPSRAEKVGFRVFTRAQVDAELAKMRTMTPQEAAAAAARAVAEVEVALEAAEKAANEAEVAEVDAEEAEDTAEKVKTKMRKYLYI